MEEKEFDATLGGNEELPYSANTMKFAASRSIEIAAMTESILRPSKTKLIFQTLPVHMRRRVMSHNSKRLPRKLRLGHLDQLKKSGLPPKQKRPSRKYRRRPTNLLEEYNRRQKRNAWLETHIWHAKRFHMIERWGYRLAHAPCDKGFRACYRATSAHCLMQDISYLTPIKITGTPEHIKTLFSMITSGSCGLSITARAYITGNRQGRIHLYKPNEYPLGYVGKVTFIWENSSEDNKNLWLFVHPSQVKEIECLLNELLKTYLSMDDGSAVPEKRRKFNENCSQHVKIQVFTGSFNIFRLTGPKSHQILANTFKCVNDNEKFRNDKWVSSHYSGKTSQLKLDEKKKYWENIIKAASPSQLSPHIVLGLVVKDPRLSRPSKRTKAKRDIYEDINIEDLKMIPPSASISPVWNTDMYEVMKENRLTNGQFVEHITKTQLVPGEVYEEDRALQSIPVVLIQRPGSQVSEFKKLGYGCGWDIIVPSGYGLPFWQTFIMFGARPGGLRETESLSFEMGECYLPPDSLAGNTEEKRIEADMKEKYFRRPPSKRVNYTKLGINSPFIPQWNILLKDWSNQNVNSFFVMRDRQLLEQLQECLHRKSKLPHLENSAVCLVPVYLHMAKRGSLRKHAVICLPKSGDISVINTLREAQHEDSNEKLRKQMRVEHKKNVKQLKRRKIKRKKKGIVVKKEKANKQTKKEPSEYAKKMRELWLPSNINNVRNTCSREVMGYLSQGAFSFSEANSCGVGYVAYNALSLLVQNGFNYVLVRNTSSFKYRIAKLQIIKSQNL
ncbi:ribonucleases P/MRP protein subunit POP1 [Plutella xylostella]|uniref:ribonucleases P/MRP protein subunit POP1 n=1 Tax=Plutella xylostella TaxID=51655 RepID=UPI00203276DD|nr:ribonucleases P/MRP protein subunit POP1 [Plutella xylostella]